MRRAIESGRFWLALQSSLSAVALAEYAGQPRLAFWLMVAAAVCGAFGTALAVPRKRRTTGRRGQDGTDTQHGP